MASKKTTRAFTLIEIIIVLAVIGLIMAFATLSYSNIRSKGRDVRRLKDISQIETALKLYAYNEHQYPASLNFGQNLIGPTSSSTYMELLPQTQTPNDGACTDVQNNFIYTQTENGESYTVSFCLGKATGNFSAGPKCLTPSGIIDFDCSAPELCSAATVCGSSCDYGGQNYNTVQIGAQCWFKENLNIGDRIDNSGAYCVQIDPSHDLWSCQTNDSALEKYCYDNDSGNCDNYGGLYEWAEALDLPYACNNADIAGACTINTPHQGICPDGWHIPTAGEQEMLAQTADDDPGCTFGTCYTAGGKLKSISWDGTDDYGFSALPAGAGYMSNFNSLDGSFNLWSATPTVSRLTAEAMNLNSADDGAYNSGPGRFNAYSIRCVKD